MDCLEFRRQLGSGARFLDASALAHLAVCTAGCANAAAEAQAFDARLAAALAVPVPADLAGRVRQAQRVALSAADPAPRRRTAWIAFAAAATLVLAFGIAQWRRNAASLPDLVVAHVTAEDERGAWSLREPLAAAPVQAAFAARGVPLAAPPPPGIAYVAECGVGRTLSVHMVMPEEGQPVAVVFVPGRGGASVEAFRRDDLSGRAMAIGSGTLFLLARSDRRFDALEHAWRDAIEGPARIAAGSR